MPKLVTKFKYIKPGGAQGPGGYAKYIATREGVDKIDDTQKLAPATVNQKKMIERLIRDYPDTKETLEYEDYLRTPNMGNASELISHALERNTDSLLNAKTYADYIATRPRAQRFGSHGLFTDDGVQVQLEKVSQELNMHTGNIWTVIISLHREDAARLGFDTGERWRDMLRSQTQELSSAFKIPMNNLKWFAAFHNEGHHPHVHMIVYSKDPREGFLNKEGVEHLRSVFAKGIFEQDLFCAYDKQTKSRDELRACSKDVIADVVQKINSGTYDNPEFERKLEELSERLVRISGKKVYGYLKSDVKDLVDSIVDELAKDSRIQKLYDLWYLQREAIVATYTSKVVPRVPLSKNKEFKSIHNAVIQEAMNLIFDREPFELPEDGTYEDIMDDEPEKERDWKYRWKEDIRVWNLYQTANSLLDKNGTRYDPKQAVDILMDASKMGCVAAKYKLGKIFLYGEGVPRNFEYAFRWLEEAADERNPYAEYLLGKIYLEGTEVDPDWQKADKYLRDSVKQNNPNASYLLAKAILNSDIPTDDADEVIKLLRNASGDGSTAAQYLLGKLLLKGEGFPQDTKEALRYLEQASRGGNAYAAYLAGMVYMKNDQLNNTYMAQYHLERAAELGNHYAEYQLGKFFLYGQHGYTNMEKAIEYLETASQHGNTNATQLLHSIRVNGNWAAAMGGFRLLGYIGKILEDRLDEDRRSKLSTSDSKLRRKIDEKKRAQGLKRG